MDCYTLGYHIHFNRHTRLYSGVIFIFETGKIRRTIMPTYNHYYTDPTKAENYVLQRIRHHRENKPCKFIGKLNLSTYDVPLNAEVLYTIPKKREKKTKIYEENTRIGDLYFE